MLSLSRMVRIVTRVAAWATPKVQKWNRERNMNRTEAKRHMEARNWSEAQKHLQAALAERKRSAADRLDLLLNLCEAQRGQGKLDAAQETAGEALKLAIEQRQQAMHSRALEAVACVQLDLGQFEQAEKTTQEVIHQESTQPNPDFARLASCSRKLAAAYERSQQPAEASKALQQSAEYAEKAYGADHAETAGHLHDLGMLHRRHGRHGDAQNCLRRALHIHRSTTGADSHQATQALHNLAASLEEAGDFTGAAAEYEKLLTVRERQVGANPMETADAQVRLAGLLLKSNRLAQARELLLPAIAMLERKGGSLYVTALDTMAGVEERSGRADAAREYREKAKIAAAVEAVR